MSLDADGFEVLVCRKCKASKPASLFLPSSLKRSPICIKCQAEYIKTTIRYGNSPASKETWRGDGQVWSEKAHKFIPLISSRKGAS